MTSQYQIPATPRVISPSPTPSDSAHRDGYFSTRGTNGSISSPAPIAEASERDEKDTATEPELERARSRSRNPALLRRKHTIEMNRIEASSTKSAMPPAAASRPTRRKPEPLAQVNGTQSNGHLSPQSAGYGRDYWRQLSRSPSPLGLIPIHREWRTFVSESSPSSKAL